MPARRSVQVEDDDAFVELDIRAPARDLGKLVAWQLPRRGRNFLQYFALPRCDFPFSLRHQQHKLHAHNLSATDNMAAAETRRLLGKD